jgi:DNA repair exonuclease SbcCD nuclease subunit
MDMGRITVLHTADLHLGTSFKGLPPKVGRQRRKDLMQTLTKITEMCRQHQVDLLLISGDLWEQDYVTRPLVDFVADQFRRIPATRVIIAPGQADYNHPDSFYHEYPWPNNVHIFHQQQLSSIWLPHLNARVYGLAWTGKVQPPTPDWNQISNDSGCQSIIVAYGSPENLKLPQKVLEMESLAYVALGGAHKHVAWDGKVLDPGSPEPLGFSPSGQGGVFLGKIGMPSAHLEFVSVSSRQYISVTVDLANSSNQNVADAVREAVNSHNPGQNLFSIALTGNRPRGEWNPEGIALQLEDIFYLSLEDQTNIGYDIETLMAENSRGVIGKYITAIREADNDKALVFGLDALLSGRVSIW